ncbi:MAG: HypC/HybG/HupF family hydrogenase formation chaperone [Actinomycetota bacterium]
MCLGIPGQIIEILEDSPLLAKADVAGVRRNVNIGLVEADGIAPGDWVLIHVGFAMSKIDEAEASSTMAFLEDLGQAYTDEIEALTTSSID